MEGGEREGPCPFLRTMDELGPSLVSTRSGPSHAFEVPLVTPQEFLAEHVVESGLGEDFDSRAFESPLVSLLQLATLSITTEHA